MSTTPRPTLTPSLRHALSRPDPPRRGRPIVRLLPTPAGYPQTALLGTGTLRHFAVTLDQANRRVRLARGDPVVPAEPPLRRARKFQYACATAAARTRAQLSACVTAAC